MAVRAPESPRDGSEIPRPRGPGGTLDRGERATFVLRAILAPRPDGVAPANLKLVLLLLDQFSGNRDHCWPSVDLLAACSGLNRRSIQRAIHELVDRGLLDLEPGPGGGRPPADVSTRGYWIRYERLAELPRAGRSVPGGVTPRRPRGDTTPPQGVTPRHPETDKHNGMGNINAHEAWMAEIRPALLELGVAVDRTVLLCRQAGSLERVHEILAAATARGRRIKNRAAYFARWCGRPDWKPTEAELRHYRDTLARVRARAPSSSNTKGSPDDDPIRT